MNVCSVYQHLQKDKQRKQRHSLKLGKKRRKSSKRNYYIISSRVIIKAIIIIVGTSLPEIAWSAWMSASSFAGSPRCAFTLTRNVAAPAAVLFRRSSIASNKMSASGDTPEWTFQQIDFVAARRDAVAEDDICNKLERLIIHARKRDQIPVAHVLRICEARDIVFRS